MPLSGGDKLGPYEIVAPIGAGGMGEVYKANDTRLGRIVAIKRLHGQHVSASSRIRFEQEARAIAALNHPNICQVYDVGPDYLVLEYIEGKPLVSKQSPGPMPVDEAVPMALQIAAALEEAHRRGITHRDLKPDNILKTRTGIKILDFGLAKLAADADATKTVEGTVMGTPAYMSPEQAQGKSADARSDIFSFGAVLYEMLSGRRAFPGDSIAATLATVLSADPAPIPAPAALERIVMRCLRKAPEERFQTIAEVKKALEQAMAKPAEQQPSIAVLPFANMSPDKDQEYFSDGLAEEIINLLAQVPGLKVIARTSAFAFRGKEQDIRAIAGTLGVSTVLEGSVRRAGNRIRVTAQLISAEDGSHLFSERYDREMADVFAMQDEIAAAITAALRIRLSPKSATPHRYTPKLPAYEAYLKAKYQEAKVTPESFELRKRYYELAITLDPGFALAYVGLSYYYIWLTTFGRCPAHEAVRSARAEAHRALQMDPSLPEAHAVLGYMATFYDLDFQQAELHFERAMEHQPASAFVRPLYGQFQFLRGKVPEAIEIVERVIQEDPLEVWPRMNLHAYLQAAGRDAEAREQVDRVLELDANLVVARVSLSMFHADRGALQDALSEARRNYAVGSWFPDAIATLAALLRRNGEDSESQRLLQELGPGDAFGDSRAHAVFHLLCGEVDQGADWVEKAIEERDLSMMYYLRFVVSKGLRASPRWPKIAKMVNLPVDAMTGATAVR